MFSNVIGQWKWIYASRVLSRQPFSRHFSNLYFARAQMQALQKNLSWHFCLSVEIVSCVDLNNCEMF